MIHFLCVVSLASAAVLSADKADKKSPETNLEKFEEKMKKKWDSILEKHPIDLAETTDAPEGLAAPTAVPEHNILDSLRQLDESTAAPTLMAALDDLDVATTAAPHIKTADDISAELAHLKARLHLDAETTATPLAATETPPVSDLLANLHDHIHDVHSSVHDALEGSLNHPGIKHAVDALSNEDDASDEDKDGLSMMAPPKAEGDEDYKPEQTKDDAEDDAAPAKLSSEKEAAMEGMKKLMGAVKMIVMLQPMLEPLKEKLSLAVEHMSAKDAEKAKKILQHIKVLGVYSKVTAGLMAGVVAAKKGTAEDREKAIATLIVGVKQIQGKVAQHLVQMKKDTLALPHIDMSSEGAPDADAPDAKDGDAPDGAPHDHAEKAMDKMTMLLVKLGKKIATEIKDPANRHNPKVLLDIKLFLAVKDSVEKTQALMMAGSIAIKKAKTSEEKDAVQAAVKKGMMKVETSLKAKMMALEKQALILAVAAAKQQQQEKGHGHADDEAEDEEEEPAPADKKAGKNKAEDDGDDDAPSHAAKGKEEEEEEDPAPEEKKPAAKAAPKKAAPAKKEDEEEEEDVDDDKADGDEKDEKAPATPPKKSGLSSEEEQAKANNPSISASDIENIFQEAADDATSDGPRKESLAEDEVHLRTH